jgi:PhoH-like ATPase
MLFEKNRIFVLDTNVILYDHRAIFNFQEHNVVLPITVLEEVDKFKKGSEIINYNAREFTRELDALASDMFLNEGMALEGGGFLIVLTEIGRDPEFQNIFWEDSPDHRILGLAHNLSKKYGSDRVALVSKDINLRMKAKSIGVTAEDYETGKVSNIDKLYTGKNLYENIDSSVIDELYRRGSIDREDISSVAEPKANEYFIFRNESQSILTVYNQTMDTFDYLEKKKAYGIIPRNAEQVFALDALMNRDISLVTLSGKAGTGKTLMALSAALEVRKYYKQILLARPVIPLSNKDIGFLPGDIQSKLDPYMQPLFDNLSVIQNQYDEESGESQKINNMLATNKLLITALAFIRGRSLPRVFFIVDEAQNLTPHEVKTIITRAGEGTKIVFTGDPHQIDTPYLDSRSNGLTYLIDKMKGQKIYAHVTMEKGERSELAEIASNIL